MPDIRPFRALRFDPTTVGDLAAVVAPPYGEIDAAEHERLLARGPVNVVRVDLPEVRHGDEPDDRFRRAARTMAEWRSSAILHKDPHPSVYLYERALNVPGTDDVRQQRGYFARLRLEAFGTEAGILPGAGSPSGSAEDRYRLLRATGVNTSPVIGLYDDPGHRTEGRIAALCDRPADVDLVDEEGIRHRVWAAPADGDGELATAVASLLEPATAGPITIAAGYDVYATALRYRDERRMSRSCEEDPAFDYVLTLFLERADQTLDPKALTGLAINPHEW